MLEPQRVAPETIRPLARAEYDVLVASGVFEDERVELLEGCLVTMSPQGAFHSAIASRIAMLLGRVLDIEVEQIRVHSPLALGDYSEPEPDVALVPPGDYKRELPTRAELVIEVSDSSLNKDRDVKARLYAAAAIGEYWIVNLRAGAVEVHRDPTGDVYADRSVYEPGQHIDIPGHPGARLAVADILA